MVLVEEPAEGGIGIASPASQATWLKSPVRVVVVGWWEVGDGGFGRSSRRPATVGLPLSALGAHQLVRSSPSHFASGGLPEESVQ